MHSIISEIQKFKKDGSLLIDYSNRDRYRIITNNPNGSKTAFCFSTPVYNEHTGSAVSLKFKRCENGIYHAGSNADITVTDKIHMKNKAGKCSVLFDSALEFVNENMLSCGKDLIFASLNGITYKADTSDKKAVSFTVKTDTAFTDVKANDGCLALMRLKFIPFLTVSCIGTVNKAGEVCAPARLLFDRVNDNEFKLTAEPCDLSENAVMFEINLYEPKIIGDTTVESLHPKKKNPFGGAAFIGDSEYYGRQWLYLRPEIAGIRDILNRHTERIILHIPRLSRRYVPLEAYKTAEKFCSFGSSWENSADTDGFIGETVRNGSYIDLDITDAVIDRRVNRLSEMKGIIIKPKTEEKSMTAVSTGDSYYKPIIIEIKNN